LEFVSDKQQKTPFPAEKKLAQTIWQTAFDMGLSLYYSQGCADGHNGDLILIGPPLIVNESELEDIVSILTRAIEHVLQ
jgi:adenosylmethionine-8-amino-7-oxononanoate aminotransferase